MKISIVFAYYNRRNLMLNTLRSIANTQYSNPLELIIVNDASNYDQQLEDVGCLFPNLDICIVNISKESKTWINPCVPNSIGISKATGDVIILQNPECFHVGNVIRYVEENIRANMYIVFGCYSVDSDKTEQLLHLKDATVSNVGSLLAPMANVHVSKAGANRWYQHSKYNPVAFNFCAAITKQDLDDLGGFDTRYAYGIAKDDKEFILRVRRKGMVVNYVDSPFVIHQWHSYTDYSNAELFAKNTKLYEELVVSDTYRVTDSLRYQL